MMRFLMLCLPLVGLSVGCGGRTGTVSGEVTYQGKPVPGGFVTFRPFDASANSVSYTLERDGKFRVELPVGEVHICIDNREFEPRPAVTAPKLPGMNLPPEVLSGMEQSAKASRLVSDRWVKLPDKYYQIETSGLTYTVTPGAQEFNIVLTD